MQPEKDYGKRVQTRLPETLHDELKDFCYVRGLKVQEFVADAIRTHLMRSRGLLSTDKS